MAQQQIVDLNIGCDVMKQVQGSRIRYGSCRIGLPGLSHFWAAGGANDRRDS